MKYQILVQAKSIDFETDVIHCPVIMQMCHVQLMKNL